MRRTTIVLLALAALLPRTALAQRTAPAFRPSYNVDLDPPVSLRLFVMGAEELFAASETFNAVFGHSYQPLFGGGLQVVIDGKYYVEVNASRFKKTGQRVFRSGGQTFGLGIPLTATLVPVEIVGGYRFRFGRAPRVRPYLAAGAVIDSYKESSDFTDATDNVKTSHAGFAANAGVEVRVHRWIGLAGDLDYSRVRGIIGDSGVSKDFGEKDLGGVAARFRMIIGR